MFMPFIYYRNTLCSKCLGRAVSGAEKDLNLALIGYCGYFHFSLWQLELLFCGQFRDGPLEKLSAGGGGGGGGEGAGEVQKKN